MWPMQLGSHRNDSPPKGNRWDKDRGMSRFAYDILWKMFFFNYICINMIIEQNYAYSVLFTEVHLPIRSTKPISVFWDFRMMHKEHKTSFRSESVVGWIPISFILRLCGRQDPKS